jgi:D-alanyl-D-alanine carboxypeptidase
MPRQTTTHASTTAGYRKRVLLVLVTIVLALIALKLLADDQEKPPAANQVKTHTAQSEDNKQPEPPAFDKNDRSLTDPNSIWVVVNKQHPLQPKSFTPDLVLPTVALRPGRSASGLKLARTMATPLQQLFDAAAAAGYHLRLTSAYRSYGYQIGVYNRIVASAGQTSADEQSARPGYSEHQTGLAADVAPLNGRCELLQCFGGTAEGQWLAKNAYIYGFIIRYPADKEAVTGYEYEPWHIRYIGTDLAAELHKTNTETLEEFFDVSGGTLYK